MQQNEILVLIPRDIRMRIVHPGDIAQIEGFRELFILLNTDPRADELRQLIVTYFNNSPSLQGHLGQSVFLVSVTMRDMTYCQLPNDLTVHPSAGSPLFSYSGPPSTKYLSTFAVCHADDAKDNDSVHDE